MLEAYQWSTGLRRQAAAPPDAPAASPAIGVAVPLAANTEQSRFADPLCASLASPDGKSFGLPVN
jgi:hypothetical protein